MGDTNDLDAEYEDVMATIENRKRLKRQKNQIGPADKTTPHKSRRSSSHGATTSSEVDNVSSVASPRPMPMTESPLLKNFMVSEVEEDEFQLLSTVSQIKGLDKVLGLRQLKKIKKVKNKKIYIRTIQNRLDKG